MPGSIHRVQRVVFDLHCGDHTTAFKARKRLAHAFSDSLGKVLGEVFDGHSPNGRPYRIRRMEIDLGVLDLDRLDDQQIRDHLLSSLRRKFLELGADHIEPVDQSAPAVDVLIHFLMTGSIPWDAQEQSLLELERTILELEEADHRMLAKRLSRLFESPAARIRFGHQFGREFFLWVLDLLHPDAAHAVETIVAQLDADLRLSKSRVTALTAVVSAITDSPSQAKIQIADRFTELLSQVDEEETTKDLGSAIDEFDDEPRTFYTKSAGIVLLHPFLERFFKALGLLNDDNVFSTPGNQIRAIHLLYYLTTGKQRPEEHELILEKVLCNWPIHRSLHKQLELSEAECAESENLLGAVITHWGRLGDTSPDGIREAFLRREGRLTLEEGRWELIVEQRGVDVLLDALPWSLYRIHLPWMEARIQVEWA